MKRFLQRIRISAAAVVLTVGIVDTAVAETITMLVPSRMIYPGEKLVASDFIEKPFIVTAAGARKYVTSVDQVEDVEATRVLNTGKPIAIAFVRKVSSVRKGQTVRASLRSGSITIEAQLVALEDGAAGQDIKARHITTGRQLVARVRDDGTLEIIKQ
jgi:flagellar basal body P-ring formation protein FlgA